MARKAEQLKTELVEKAVALAQKRLDGPRAEAAARFIREFYANVSPDDLVGAEVENLYGAALSLWNHGQKRLPGQAKVRVFNPRLDEHGWRSAHTVVEIVNDDMPFLVDSVTAELDRDDLTVHLVIHPVIEVARDAQGLIVETGPTHDESFMQIRMNEQRDPHRLDRIRRDLERVLADVRAAVTDWRAMRAKVEEALPSSRNCRRLCRPRRSPRRATSSPGSTTTISPSSATASTISSARSDQARTSILPGSGLGILRDDSVSVFDELRNFERLPPEVRYFLHQSRLLMITKANRRATVHRPVQMDTIGVKNFDADGKVIGERLFVGLFTSARL